MAAWGQHVSLLPVCLSKPVSNLSDYSALTCVYLSSSLDCKHQSNVSGDELGGLSLRRGADASFLAPPGTGGLAQKLAYP